MSKFKVEIVETYRRYVEIEAKDEDAAYDNIDSQVEEGAINLFRDGKDYKYDRKLIVSKIKDNLQEVINMKDIVSLLDKYNQNYELLSEKVIRLYDKGDGSYTAVEIGDDNTSVSYEGCIIGGLDELERRL